VYRLLQEHNPHAGRLSDEFVSKGRQKFGDKAMDKWENEPWWHHDHQGLWFLYMDLLNGYYNQKVGAYINVVRNEHRLLSVASYLSPSLLFMNTVTRLSATGVDNYLQQMQAVLAYHGHYNTFLKKKVEQHTTEHKRNLQQPPLKPNLEGLEKLKIPSEPWPNRVAGILWQLFALGLYAALFFLAGFYVFVKRDVE
jgi:hypothetical protein